MPEGYDQNQNSQGSADTNPPSEAGGSSYTPQSSGSIDSINGGSQTVEEVNLGPNQIAPNLAREEGYFGERPSTPQSTAPQTTPEMQYPSYNEESESSFNPKLILIIFAVGVILLGSIGGIFYYFKSQGTDVAEEEVVIEEDGAGEEESATEEDSNSTPEPTPTPIPVVTPTPTPAPVETPIVVPQPEEKTPDNTEGSG